MTEKPTKREDVKSDEEWHTVLWLQEAVEHGLVESWEYELQRFILFGAKKFTETKQLKTKSKEIDRCLHREEGYTPDFCIEMTDKGAELLYSYFKASLWYGDGKIIHIDVKGTYNPYQNDQRYFSIVQKAMFHVHGIWVPKVIPFYTTGKKNPKTPKGLFVETFAPESLRWMKNGRELNRIGRACDCAKDFVTSLASPELF